MVCVPRQRVRDAKGRLGRSSVASRKPEDSMGSRTGPAKVESRRGKSSVASRQPENGNIA
ncbi:hypothetical protein E2C01_094929 [Portunus trituberculatus]|uniref:Uncharacterized protein n=1 Tax=Portunus trituberculatus TaxID=210409 RepID=A0A5B7JRS5_PORTR|nr:hypothetical protein [Portunus trituberculatus]